MERFHLRRGYSATVLILLAVVVSACGCRTALTAAAYLIKGTDIDPQYAGLKEKRVAVVCRPVASLTYGYSSEARKLAREVGILLRNRVPKIEVIDQDEVNDWTDNHDWIEYPEIGEALGANMVVGIDLAHFGILLDQTLYQGKANATVKVYDCASGGSVVYEEELPQLLYPPNTGIPTSSKPEQEFRRKFIRILADQIGRHFYRHDAHADYALDATAMD